MAELPSAIWLPKAKRLPVGRTTRITHGREKRPNLVIGNDTGKWWAYCQACKVGAVVDKEHVRITGGAAPVSSTNLSYPSDACDLLRLDEFTRDAVLGLLASKNMDQMYLPPLQFSESRKRLLVDTGQGLLGRDTTGHSPQKWLTYSGTLWLESQVGDGLALVVEDPFSYYKVRWALRNTDVSIYCALGTVVRPALALKLLPHSRAVLFFDGDEAGYTGAKRESKKLRGLGCEAVARGAPTGFDPKDLTIQEIQTYAERVH